MVEMDALGEKIFALLKGNGLKIKIFNEQGAETTDPKDGRRFFSMIPNIMITIDEDGNTIEFSEGNKESENENIRKLQKHVKNIANEFLMNYNVKVFGKSIQPRDYAYQAKMQKDNIMEHGMQPVNHHLAGEIIRMVKHFGGKIGEWDLTSNLGIATLSDIRPTLNRLVHDKKLKAEMHNGALIYSIPVEEAVMESLSKMFGSKRTSQQTLENVKILVRHKTPVDENIRGARARNISAIFLETNGERFRFPSNYLNGARAMAQHIAHGGTMNDKVGSYIIENVNNLIKLQSFNRYVSTNKLINEDSSMIVETIKENINTIKEELKKLTGIKTYETVKARIETFEKDELLENDVDNLRDMFTIRRFDEKFDEVLPIIKQMVQEKDTYHKRIEEASANIIYLKKENINTVPMLEFSSEYAELGFKLNELAVRIQENAELSGFINKIGNKLYKESTINEFEKAILCNVFENIQIYEDKGIEERQEIKECIDFEFYLNKFNSNLY